MTELTLEERVADFVAANPGLTMREIARGVRARMEAVLDVLRSEAFQAAPRRAHPSDRAVVYFRAPVAGEQKGRAVRRTQCELIASLLSDGKRHTSSEIHQRCGPSRLNSRIAELRDPKKRWGMVIVCHHVDGQASGPDAYEYELVGYLPGFGLAAATSEATAGRVTRTGSAPAVASDASADKGSPPESLPSEASDSLGAAA